MNEGLLITEREKLLSSVVDYFVSDPSVVGLFLGGSLPAGTADAYSDIDMRVVVTPDEHERFVSSRLEMPKHWGNFLFNEWLEGATHCVSHFQPFLKIDVFYICMTDCKPSPWLSLPTDVLYDPKGILADVIGKSMGLPFEVDEDEIDRSISKGIACVHEVYRRVRRGELFFAQSLLDGIRHYMTQADDWINSRPPQAVTLSKLEQRGSESIIQTFQKSYVGLDGCEIDKALRELLVTFRQQVVDLHKKFRLRRALKNDLDAIDVILDGGHGIA